MNSNTMLKELKNQLSEELAACKLELESVRKKTKILNIMSIILSSVVTVLAGLKTFTFPAMSDIILFISAAVTIIGGIKAFFNYEKQNQYLAKTFFDLGLLDREIDLYINALDGGSSDGQVVTDFANRYLGIVYDHAQKVISFKEKDEKALNTPEK